MHRTLGCGYVDRVYRRPLAFEFAERRIPFESEVAFPIEYKGRRTGVVYRLDFICFGEVVIELKALRSISGLEMAQTLNYLRASGLHRALILNFGSTRLEVRRLVWGPPKVPRSTEVKSTEDTEDTDKQDRQDRQDRRDP